MAFMDQRQKAFLAPAIKAVLKKYDMKGTIGVRNHSTLVVNISQGALDIISNMYEIAMTKPDSFYARDRAPKPLYMQVNAHWIGENYSGKCKEFLMALGDVMDVGNHDRSDIQTDYFDIGWYKDINIGQWDKPYQFIA